MNGEKFQAHVYHLLVAFVPFLHWKLKWPICKRLNGNVIFLLKTKERHLSLTSCRQSLCFFSFNFHFLVSLFENGACLTSLFCLSIHNSQVKVPNKTSKRPKRGEILGLLDQGVCNT